MAASISVSSPSPTTRGRLPPTRRIVSSNNGGSGFPATTGFRPVNRATTSTNTPLPGPAPWGVGTVISVFDATHGSPSRTSNAPATTVDQRRAPEYPDATARGAASRSWTGFNPCSASAPSSPSPPMTNTGDPSSSRSPGSRAAVRAPDHNQRTRRADPAPEKRGRGLGSCHDVAVVDRDPEPA